MAERTGDARLAAMLRALDEQNDAWAREKERLGERVEALGECRFFVPNTTLQALDEACAVHASTAISNHALRG